jgi:hypothetical protein
MDPERGRCFDVNDLAKFGRCLCLLGVFTSFFKELSGSVVGVFQALAYVRRAATISNTHLNPTYVGACEKVAENGAFGCCCWHLSITLPPTCLAA